MPLPSVRADYPPAHAQWTAYASASAVSAAPARAFRTTALILQWNTSEPMSDAFSPWPDAFVRVLAKDETGTLHIVGATMRAGTDGEHIDAVALGPTCDEALANVAGLITSWFGGEPPETA